MMQWRASRKARAGEAARNLAPILLLALAPSVARALDRDPELRQLAGMSLDELMSIEVTSVAGVEQEWFDTPAAIYVITPVDARRSGHRTLAEVLRLAPGMHVAQIDSFQWRVEPRGFTGVTIRSNKNLVLIDGRTVWDPLYSGVWWDVQDVLLEDLDRIEVIRGPGATLWGSNAVNGVINVTTQSARETQGLYVTGGYGNHERGFGALRYGGQLSQDAWFRVWGKYFNRDSFDTRDDLALGFDSGHDDWSLGRLGFRIDGEGPDDVTYTLLGGTYDSFTYGVRAVEPVPDAHMQFREIIGDGRISGRHLLARVSRNSPDGSGFSAQAYYDRTDRTGVDHFEVDRDTYDAEWRHWFEWGPRQSFIWGVRGNITTDRVDNSLPQRLVPRTDSHYTVSAFAQNTTELVEDRWFAMLGSKIEYNDYTGVEAQPSARLWWTPNASQMVWAAISRAVRVPSRLERDFRFATFVADEGLLAGGAASGTFTPVVTLFGNDDLDAEELIAYELGHRIRLASDLTVDTALFYHDYDELIAVPQDGDTFTNDGYGESYGVEVSTTWRVAANWRVQAAYSFVNVHHRGPIQKFEAGNTPHHQAHLRSYYDLTEDIEVNAALYFVDNLPSALEPSRIRADLGVTWRVNQRLELAVWGQNLLDPRHSESSALDVPRTFYVQGTLRF